MEDYRIDEMQAMPFEQYQNIFAFWPETTVDHPYEDFMTIIYDWCLENLGRHGWYVSGNKVFLDDEHIMAFKLRW